MTDGDGKKKRNLYWLMAAAEKANLADELTQEELGRLGSDVVRTYEMDRNDRKDWDDLSDRAMKLAKQVTETKTFPWQGASNVKHPLITVAAIQFAARAYPEIVKSGQVVKCLITGDEPKQPPFQSVQPAGPGPAQIMAGPQGPEGLAAPIGPVPEQTMGQMAPGGPGGMAVPTATGPQQALSPVGPGVEMPAPPVPTKSPKQERADRIKAHMNWSLTQEMVEWEEDMDRLLHILPVLGQVYKKTYYSSVEKRNISELVLPDDCVVNYKARTLTKARRITHRLWFYENDVWEKMRQDLWLDVPLGQPQDAGQDRDAAHEFLEQHLYEDLDGDGYKEPYIVTVHKATAQVVRVVARWQPDSGIEVVRQGGKDKVAKIIPDQYFVHFGFIPNPDGSLNYFGFGQLLEPLNAAINSTLNQLIDAGTLANTGGGFIGRGVRMRGGRFAFTPGEWRALDVPGAALKENIVPIPRTEPSAVLFQLLGFLVQAGQDISSVQNIMTGESSMAATMPVGTVMALVEQGLKVFTAIYKRVYRSLTDEFRKLYDLNSKFLAPEFTFVLSGQEEEYQIGQQDYQEGNLTVVPVADPNLSSDMQRLLKSQALKELSGRPGIDEVELTRRLVRSIQPDDVGRLLQTDGQIAGKEPVAWSPPPSPQAVLAQAKSQRLTQQAQEAGLRLQMDMQRFALDIENTLADVEKKKAETLLSLARAEKEMSDVGSGQAKLALEAYKAELGVLTNQVKHQADLIREKIRAFTASQKYPGSVSADQPSSSGGSPGPSASKSSGGNGSRPPADWEAAAEAEMMRANTRRPEPGLDLGGMDSLVGRQAGGPVAAGQPYLVGEAGPEVVVPADRIGQILNNPQNVNKNFVQRLLKSDLNPMLDMSYERNGRSYTGAGTHLMSSGEVDGKGIVYPEIIQGPDGNLRRLGRDEAREYALRSGEFIQFDTPEEAEWFGKNYKTVWGQPGSRQSE